MTNVPEKLKPDQYKKQKQIIQTNTELKSPITFFMLHKESTEAGREKAQKTAWIQSIKPNRKHTKKDHRSNKGFSLIELLVTVGIIGVLAAVAIPAYNTYRQNAAIGAAETEAKGMGKSFQACLASGTAIATCGNASINGTLSPACTSAALTAAPTAASQDGCFVSHNSSDGVTCMVSLVTTGGFTAAHCVSYDPSTAAMTETKGKAELGGTITSGAHCSSGVCQ